jgi:DNA-binding CsgD family transcriptional regulator
MAKKSTSMKSSGANTKAAKFKKGPVLSPDEMFKKRSLELTDRERDVLKQFARGHSYVQIGENLEISSKTVGSYLQRIREKARAKNRSDLITLAIKEGLIGDK